MPGGGIRTHDLSRLAAAGIRLRPRGYWDRLFQVTPRRKYFREICDHLAEYPETPVGTNRFVRRYIFAGFNFRGM